MSQRGHNRERQVRKLLEADGWWVARAAGSLGDADLVASRRADVLQLKPRVRGFADVRLIECKSTAGGPYERFGPADRQRLSEAAKRAGASAWLVWWPPRGKLAWIPEHEWPKTKTAEAWEEVRASTRRRTARA